MREYVYILKILRMGGVDETKVHVSENSPVFVEAGDFHRYSTNRHVRREGRRENNTKRDITVKLRVCCFLATLERPFPTISPLPQLTSLFTSLALTVPLIK